MFSEAVCYLNMNVLFHYVTIQSTHLPFQRTLNRKVQPRVAKYNHESVSARTEKYILYSTFFKKISLFSSKDILCQKRVRILETFEFTIVLTFDVYDFYKSERRNNVQGVTFENIEFYSFTHRWRIKIKNYLES